MKSKQEIYKELKELIITYYREYNRILCSDENMETHDKNLIRYKERIDTLEEILEVKGRNND